MAGVFVVRSERDWDIYLRSGKVFIVVFTATWSGTCRVIDPVFENYATRYSSTTFLKVDVDALSGVAEQFNITTTPTFLVFVNGEKADELVGASQEKLHELIKKYAR
ncbi:unnamed protein product [Closterium sp. NIES-65]|nr:unnamed protein product [Closterium sp. NIES-65]